MVNTCLKDTYCELLSVCKIPYGENVYSIYEKNEFGGTRHTVVDSDALEVIKEDRWNSEGERML
jgi:hypothetical protein